MCIRDRSFILNQSSKFLVEYFFYFIKYYAYIVLNLKWQVKGYTYVMGIKKPCSDRALRHKRQQVNHLASETLKSVELCSLTLLSPGQVILLRAPWEAIYKGTSGRALSVKDRTVTLHLSLSLAISLAL